jgi:hypothetical protein
MLRLVTHALAASTASLAKRTDRIGPRTETTFRTFVLTVVGLLLLVAAAWEWHRIAGLAAGGLACFVLELCLASPTEETAP